MSFERDCLLGLECSGKLPRGDFETMHAWLDRKLADSCKPALGIVMPQLVVGSLAALFDLPVGARTWLIITIDLLRS